MLNLVLTTIQDHAPAAVRMACAGAFLLPFLLSSQHESLLTRALIFGLSNAMVGYVPTREAFTHGGYETTRRPAGAGAPIPIRVESQPAFGLGIAASRTPKPTRSSSTSSSTTCAR